MLSLLNRYVDWLHLQWPGGSEEPLPRVEADFSTDVPGLFVVGELTGIPLLKHAVDSGARVARRLLPECEQSPEGIVPLVIVGGGVSGLSAAVEARRLGIDFQWFEAARMLETVENYPIGKPIFTDPPGHSPQSTLELPSEAGLSREGLLESLQKQALDRDLKPQLAILDSIQRKGESLQLNWSHGESIHAHRVVLALGRSGEHRRLEVPGEDLDHVSPICHDPGAYRDRNVLVVGGGDSACEVAIALAEGGAKVHLSHRSPTLKSASATQQQRVANVTARGSLTVLPETTIQKIGESEVELLGTDRKRITLPATSVFTLIGRKPPVELLRRCGLKMHGDRGAFWWASLVGCMVFFFLLYHWKRTGVAIPIAEKWRSIGGFPAGLDRWWSEWFPQGSSLLGSLTPAMDQPGFWYSLLYTLLVLIFGLRRMRKRPSPYIRRQTWCLFWIQAIPLFLLPYWILPWLGTQGIFDAGVGQSVADALFPFSGDSREYWRAFGLILAWPLFFWNIFTDQPLIVWCVISVIQTFVLLPWAIHRWGKGVYCGWICSCGALAETLGDDHRHKMPRGDRPKSWNLIGQGMLLLCLLMLVGRVMSWTLPESTIGQWGQALALGIQKGIPLINYEWFVDLFLSGILGVGLYWHFSGRTWCRFVCPLAALMNIYARFSRFRIFADKSRCISCNVCTTQCHQGIDVMTFARQGLPMADPQCVRCGACVHDCPTDVLRFGKMGRDGVTVELDLLNPRSGVSSRSADQES